MIPPDPLIGYLAHFVTSDQNHYFGGILTTDLRGIPKEFKHTEAVKPSRTQTILYGDTLELAIGTDAIAPALYASLSRKPNLLLIEKNGKPLFGSFLLEHSPSGLIVSLKSPDLAFGEYLANEGNLINALDFDLKNSSTERVYAYLNDNPPDFIGQEILNKAQSAFNLINPFERVRRTLEEISQAAARNGRY